MGTDQLTEFKRLQKENGRLRRPVFNLKLDNLILGEPPRKISKPRAATQVYKLVMRRRFGVSGRRACRVLKQHRSTHSYVPSSLDGEKRLVQDMIELARQYGR